MNDHNTTRTTIAALALLLCGCIAEVDAPEPDPVVAPAPAPVVVEPPDAGGPAFAVCGVEKPCNCGALAWKCCLPHAGSSACTCVGPGAVTDDVNAETTAQCAELRAP